MTSILLPESEAEIEAIVIEAAASRSPLSIHGGGTRPVGKPVPSDRILSTEALAGITLYEPAELILSARAGTPLRAIEARLAADRLRFAFEPLDHRPLLGTRGEPTIGGMTAANASGPRRVQAGAARDHLIGIRAVTGRGETIKSGGRVMKNVTGYDLARLLAGSWGTLGILTEVTYKLVPVAESETTLVIEGLDAPRAVEAMATALGTPFEITGAAHLPGSPSRTCLRFEGFAASCSYREDRLRGVLSGFGPAEALQDDASRALWRDIAAVAPLGADRHASVWRISVKPGLGAEIGAAVQAALEGELLYDWAGGLIHASTEHADAGAALVHDLVGAAAGHATLVRATPEIRAAVPVFQPEPPALAAIGARLKSTFDPSGVLNPGRMG